ISFDDVSIRAVPAYTGRHAYHALAYGGLGFLISMKRWDIYYAGDTDLIPEMDTIGCDIAILPVGGIYTMGLDEAVEATRRLRPSYVIPMQYGSEVPNSREYGRLFTQAVSEPVQGVERPLENPRFATRSTGTYDIRALRANLSARGF
ncbi:MAG: hypothetical protein GYB68_08475, partial [Chloroflexi bacterium]|nr:hypothetical protein [Chloroflexota bacterium]